jgi:hypothetical protein
VTWLMRFLRDEKNREVLSWIGGGLAAIAAAAWAVFIWHSAQGSSPAATEAQGPGNEAIDRQELRESGDTSTRAADAGNSVATATNESIAVVGNSNSITYR